MLLEVAVEVDVPRGASEATHVEAPAHHRQPVVLVAVVSVEALACPHEYARRQVAGELRVQLVKVPGAHHPFGEFDAFELVGVLPHAEDGRHPHLGSHDKRQLGRHGDMPHPAMRSTRQRPSVSGEG